MNERGFTLVEAIVVIAISSVLVAIAAPGFRGFLDSIALQKEANGLYQQFVDARDEASVTFTSKTITINANPKSDITITSVPSGNMEVQYTKYGTFQPATNNTASVKYVITKGTRKYQVIVGRNSPRVPARL